MSSTVFDTERPKHAEHRFATKHPLHERPASYIYIYIYIINIFNLFMIFYFLPDLLISPRMFRSLLDFRVLLISF